MDFPLIRMRRLRRSEPMRALVRETRLHPAALIAPLFICPGEGVRRAISSMPGVFNQSIDEAIKDATEAAGRRVRLHSILCKSRKGWNARVHQITGDPGLGAGMRDASDGI